MAQIVSKRYAKALFDLATENNEIDKLFDEVKAISQAMEENSDFEGLLLNPKISKNEKMELMENIFKGKISENILGLFYTIFRKSRENQIYHILREFLEMVMEHKGVALAKVTSSSHLSKQQLDRVKEKISEKMGKEVVIEAKVDKSLISGICVETCGYVIDISIKKQITDLKKHLLNYEVV